MLLMGQTSRTFSGLDSLSFTHPVSCRVLWRCFLQKDTQKWFIKTMYSSGNNNNNIIICLSYIKELQLYAAEKMIEKLEPPLQKDNPNPNLVQWLNNIRLSQNTIESILNLKPQTERVLKSRLVIILQCNNTPPSVHIIMMFHVKMIHYITMVRHGWCRLRATQLFVENVMIKHSEVDLKLLARRLCAVSF